MTGGLLVSGCYHPEPVPDRLNVFVAEPSALEDLLPAGQHHVGGRSVLKRPIMYQTYGHGPDVTFVMGAIHGNEPASKTLAQQLGAYLETHREVLRGRTVVILPAANPDGLVYHSRHNARGVDLNRNFATGNRINNTQNGMKGLSEPESLVIAHIIRQYRPAKIVSMHQPLACIDYDGPGQTLAEAMAGTCALPVKKLGARPGSLGSYTGEVMGIPTITLEMLSSDTALSPAMLWIRYGSALVAAIRH